MGLKTMSVVLAGSLILTGKAGAQAPGPESEYLLLSRALADGSKCSWFNPVEKAALEAGRNERLAAVQAAGGASAAAAARTKAAASPAYDCSGTKAPADRAAALGAARNIGAAMVVRADAAVRATDPWAYQITTLDAHQPAIRLGASQIQAVDRNGFAHFQARETPVTIQALALVCPARKSVRVAKGDRACPTIPGVTDEARVYAAAWLSGVESFIPVYAASQPVKTALAAAATPPLHPASTTLPPGASNWSQVYVSAAPLTAFEIGSNVGGVLEADCKVSDIVAVLDGAPPKEIFERKQLKLFRIGSPAQLGSVAATGSSVGTLMPVGAAPAVVEFNAKGSLRRCRGPR